MLREVVPGLLVVDLTLELREVLVTCTDVEAFAPLVAAALSLGAQGEGSRPASTGRRIADRLLRQTHALTCGYCARARTVPAHGGVCLHRCLV